MFSLPILNFRLQRTMHSRRDVATRSILDSFHSVIRYDLYSGTNVDIQEDTTMVDGIGGTTWDGSFALASILEVLDLSKLSILELGCGSGLCGLVANLSAGATVNLTDRIIDLAAKNVEDIKIQHPNASEIYTIPLTWGIHGDREQSHNDIRCKGSVDVIIGAEIACLIRQQDALVETIDFFTGSQSVVLIGFDDQPPPNSVSYEAAFDAKMKRRGYQKAVIFAGEVTWRDFGDGENAQRPRRKIATVNNYTHMFNNDLDKVAFPVASASKSLLCRHLLSPPDVAFSKSSRNRFYNSFGNSKTSDDLEFSLPPQNDSKLDSAREDESLLSDPMAFPVVLAVPPAPSKSRAPDAILPKKAEPEAESTANMQHIAAYFRPSATSMCSRCHRRFFRHSGLSRPVIWSSKRATSFRHRPCPVLPCKPDTAWPAADVEGCDGSRRASRVLAEGEVFTLPQGVGAEQVVVAGGCRHHRGLFVCRRHPAETRLSIDGTGDGLGYYGNGKEGWGAEFWDCCGSEDRAEPGCVVSAHEPYS